MRRAMLIAFILALAGTFAYAQSWRGKGRLEGTLTDPDGKPIEGATIRLECTKYGGSFEVKSDKNGKWVAGGIRGSDWNIDIVAKGYVPRRLTNYVSEAARNKPVDLALERDVAAAAAVASEQELKEAMAVLSKGNELFGQGKFPEALAEYQAILAKNPDLTIVNVNISNCYYEMKQLDKAIEALNAVLAKEPTNTDVMSRLGNIYAEQGNLEKALEYFGKIDEKTIRNPTTFYNIGILLYNNNKTAEALSYFEKAVGVDPSFADGYFQMGLCYVNQNNLPKAKESFNTFLKLAPDSPNAPMVQNILKSL